ncbi:MAG: hypothetical protein ACKPKO_17480, partial [Candidatus Fonsibacter sp.]
DPQVGFGGRKSTAVGDSHKFNTSRKAETPVILTPTPCGTTTSANEAITNNIKDTFAMRAALREMVDVATCGKAPSGADVPPPKRMPRSRSPPSPAPPEASPAVRSASVRVASAAAVVQAAADMERFERRVGQYDDKAFDEIYDWKRDDDGVPYWEKKA